MEGRELVYLDTLALAAVTFGGFAVIAVALRQETSAHLTKLQVLIIRFLVEISLIVAFLSLMPSLLFLFRLPAPVTWRAVSVLGLAIILSWAVAYFIRRRAATGQSFHLWVWLTLAAVALSCAGLAANILDLAGATSAACYALAPTTLLTLVWINFLHRLELFVRTSKR